LPSVRSFAVARDGAHAELARTLREHEMHRALPLHLQAQRAVELEGCGEQYRCSDGLAERIADSRRVIAMFEQRAPRGIEVHDVPPDRVVLEEKPVQAIAVMHG
jgi:hypothetical protein